MSNDLLARGRELLNQPPPETKVTNGSDQSAEPVVSSSGEESIQQALIDEGVNQHATKPIKTPRDPNPTVNTETPFTQVVTDPNLVISDMGGTPISEDDVQLPGTTPENKIIQLWANGEQVGVSINKTLYHVSRPVYDLLVRTIQKVGELERSLAGQRDNLNKHTRSLYTEQ